MNALSKFFTVRYLLYCGIACGALAIICSDGDERSGAGPWPKRILTRPTQPTPAGRPRAQAQRPPPASEQQAGPAAQALAPDVDELAMRRAMDQMRIAPQQPPRQPVAAAAALGPEVGIVRPARAEVPGAIADAPPEQLKQMQLDALQNMSNAFAELHDAMELYIAATTHLPPAQ